MVEKEWKEMNGWEKAWDVTKTVLGCAVGIAAVIATWSGIKTGRIKIGNQGGQKSYPPGQGGSVHTVGSGGKKFGSHSSFRHG